MIPHNRLVLTAEDKLAVARVMESGHIGPGPEVEAFERELAERFRPGGAAACVSSGTAALSLAAEILRVGQSYEDACRLSTYACIALYHAVTRPTEEHYWYAEPPFLKDCDTNLLTPLATIVVHTYGVPCPVADDAIEDFTHAPGGVLNGIPCGSMGAASIISFGATKPLGCGSGGAVLGPPDLIAEIKDRRDYDGKRDLRPRFNWQWNDVGAALGRSRLRWLDQYNYRRWEIASAYLNAPASTDRVWYRYIVRVPDPSAAIAYFLHHGVQVINPLEPWELLHRQLGLDPGAYPNAEDAAAHTISLPIWPGMSDDEVDTVAKALDNMSVPC